MKIERFLKWKIWIVAVLLGLTGIAGLTGCSEGKPKGDVKVFLKDEGAGISVSWTMPEEMAKKAETITVNLQHIQSGTPSGTLLAASFEADTSPCYINDRLAYYAQLRELGGTGWTIRAEIFVKDAKGKTLDRNLSDTLEIKDLFPVKEAPVIGEDIPLESITSFLSSGSGSFVENNYYYLIYMDEGRPALSAHYFNQSTGILTEKSLSTDDWERLLAYISRGSLYRRTVTDPDLEKLDGSEFYMSIDWEGKTRAQGYYRFLLPEDVEEELNDWIKEIRD